MYFILVLQAMKRLISAVQRMYPTDPSRSVDFETTTDLGRGMAGAGSTKLALLQAEAKGEVGGSGGVFFLPWVTAQEDYASWAIVDAHDMTDARWKAMR
jgi:hypothetical protein